MIFQPFFLAAIAGWQDVVNQEQYKCYCNMMSGNTLNLCMAIGRADWFPTVPFILGTIAHFCASALSLTARCGSAPAPVSLISLTFISHVSHLLGTES